MQAAVVQIYNITRHGLGASAKDWVKENTIIFGNMEDNNELCGGVLYFSGRLLKNSLCFPFYEYPVDMFNFEEQVK